MKKDKKGFLVSSLGRRQTEPYNPTIQHPHQAANYLPQTTARKGPDRCGLETGQEGRRINNTETQTESIRICRN